MAMKNYVLATTDGACSGNPGPGGWAVLLNDELRSGKSLHYQQCHGTDRHFDGCGYVSWQCQLTDRDGQQVGYWSVEQRLEDQARPLERDRGGHPRSQRDQEHQVAPYARKGPCWPRCQ
jgi:hypothetical protein